MRDAYYARLGVREAHPTCIGTRDVLLGCDWTPRRDAPWHASGRGAQGLRAPPVLPFLPPSRHVCCFPLDWVAGAGLARFGSATLAWQQVQPSSPVYPSCCLTCLVLWLRRSTEETVHASDVLQCAQQAGCIAPADVTPPLLERCLRTQVCQQDEWRWNSEGVGVGAVSCPVSALLRPPLVAAANLHCRGLRALQLACAARLCMPGSTVNEPVEEGGCQEGLASQQGCDCSALQAKDAVSGEEVVRKAWPHNEAMNV